MNSLLTRLNTSGSAIIHNLGTCDVKVEGMCCYFPSFCDPIAKCISLTPTSLIDLPSTFPRCSCPDGYQGDGRAKGSGCTNINECEMGLAKCSQNCVDLIPGFRCDCLDGFRLENDGRTCRDINECIEHTHRCSHLCHNTSGSYICDCPEGYYLGEDGRTCIDIDECMEAEISGVSICPYHELCVNTDGSFECGCPPGFKPSRQSFGSTPRCEDIDECFNNAAACPNGRDQNKVTQICENVPGGHLCRCLPGLKPVYKTPGGDSSALARRLQTVETDLDVASGSEAPSEPVFSPRTESDLVESEYSRDLDGSQDGLGAHEKSEEVRISNLSPDALLSHPLSAYDRLISEGVFEFGRKGAQEKWPFDAAESAPRRLKEEGPDEGSTAHLLPQSAVRAMKERTKAILEESPGHTSRMSLGDLRSRYQWTAAQREALHCEDIDECKDSADSVARCGSQAECVNTFRSYECRCRDPQLEYDAEKKLCTKPSLNPKRHACPPSYCGGPCTLTLNGYYCGCPRGFTALSPEKWEQVSEANFDAKSEADFQRGVAAEIECADIDECAVNAHVCGIGCKCRNTVGSYDCVCDSNKVRSEEWLDNDYDILLAISNQFSEAVESFEDSNEIVRVMNHNEPRYTVMALTSMTPGVPFDNISFNVDRWLVDQIDWSKSEFLNLPDDYEDELSKLINSEHLVRDFVRATASALRKSAIGVCARQDPCVRATCPASKPCCLTDQSGKAHCLPTIKSAGVLFNRMTKPTCPANTVMKVDAVSQRP